MHRVSVICFYSCFRSTNQEFRKYIHQWCIKIYYWYSYGPWTPTKCDSILIFTSFNNKVCCDIAYFNTKMSYLSDFKRAKSKTLRTATQTEDELNKSAVWSSANNRNKRFTFLKFDYRKYSNFLLHAIYVWNGHRERRSSRWNLQLHTRLAERYRWRCADLHSDWFHAVMTHSPFSVQFIEEILNRCKDTGLRQYPYLKCICRLFKS